jgi:hypothetical protein
VEVSGKTAGISQVNIFFDGNNGAIDRNESFATSVFDGIRVQGDQSRVTRTDKNNRKTRSLLLD